MHINTNSTHYLFPLIPIQCAMDCVVCTPFGHTPMQLMIGLSFLLSLPFLLWHPFILHSPRYWKWGMDSRESLSYLYLLKHYFLYVFGYLTPFLPPSYTTYITFLPLYVSPSTILPFLPPITNFPCCSSSSSPFSLFLSSLPLHTYPFSFPCIPAITNLSLLSLLPIFPATLASWILA